MSFCDPKAFFRLPLWFPLLLAFIAQSPLPVPQDSEPETHGALQNVYDVNGQIHAVVLMDSILCLSVEQTQQALEIVKQEWKSEWNQEMASMTLRIWSNPRRKMIESIDRNKFEEILRPSQFQALQSLPDFLKADFQHLLVLAQRSEEECAAYLANAKDVSLQLMELKSEEIDELLGLDAKQRKLMKVACKGAINEVAREWEEALENYTQHPQDKDAIDSAMKLVRNAMSTQCIAGDVWNKVLRKVFSEEQLKLIQTREAKRNEMAKRQFLQDILIFWIPDDSKITAEQNSALLELVFQKTNLKTNWDMLGAEKQIAHIPDEEFQAIFDEKQWKTVSGVIRSLRQQWPKD